MDGFLIGFGIGLAYLLGVADGRDVGLRSRVVSPIIDWFARRTGRVWFWYVDDSGERRLYFDKPDRGLR